MFQSFVNNCLREIESRQISYIRTIGSGTCPTIEAYRTLCGKVQGLEEGRELIRVLFKNALESHTSLNEKPKGSNHDED